MLPSSEPVKSHWLDLKKPRDVMLVEWAILELTGVGLLLVTSNKRRCGFPAAARSFSSGESSSLFTGCRGPRGWGSEPLTRPSARPREAFAHGISVLQRPVACPGRRVPEADGVVVACGANEHLLVHVRRGGPVWPPSWVPSGTEHSTGAETPTLDAVSTATRAHLPNACSPPRGTAPGARREL